MTSMLLACCLACPAPSSASEQILLNKIPSHDVNGAVLDVADGDHFDSAWVGSPSILFDGKTYRMWYSSFFSSSEKEGRGGIGLATSSDGIHWQRANGGKPVLEVGPAGAFDAGQVMGPEVLYDGTTYRMWYTGDPGEKHSSGIVFYAIGLATSRDGIHFKRENDGKPVLPRGDAGANDEVQAATPSILKDDDNGYRMWYAAWAPPTNHTICTARSADGIRWMKERDGKPVAGLEPSIAYGHAVARVGKRYVMLYQALKAERSLYGAISDDGTTWSMLNDGKPVISPAAAPDAFDRNIVGHPFVLAQGGKLRVWYTGYQTNSTGPKTWRLRIGLAEGDVSGWVRE